MEKISHLYNQLHFDSSDLSSPTGISYSSSASSAGANLSVSDDEVKLASRNPKKRGGRKKFRETRHPVFRGVRKRNSGKWVCEVRQPNNNKSRIWLGTYETVDMAARAHDVAALALRGRSACLNFADSMWRLPIPASSDVKDIQRAAAEAAEMFGPYQEQSHVVSVDDLVIDESEITSSLPENMFFSDEPFFGMPELLANMAEGLMMLPPPHRPGDEYGSDDVEINCDMSLWSY